MHHLFSICKNPQRSNNYKFFFYLVHILFVMIILNLPIRKLVFIFTVSKLRQTLTQDSLTFLLIFSQPHKRNSFATFLIRKERMVIIIALKYHPPFGNGCLRNLLKYLTSPNQSASRQNTSHAHVHGTTCIMRIFELLLIEYAPTKTFLFCSAARPLFCRLIFSNSFGHGNVNGPT